MRFSRFGGAICGLAAALGLAPEHASALPADAACVYLAIGCYAPSPVPAPAFPDPLFAPIQVPSIFAPAPAVVAVPAPEVEVVPPGVTRPHRHHRKSRYRHNPE